MDAQSVPESSRTEGGHISISNRCGKEDILYRQVTITAPSYDTWSTRSASVM